MRKEVEKNGAKIKFIEKLNAVMEVIKICQYSTKK